MTKAQRKRLAVLLIRDAITIIGITYAAGVGVTLGVWMAL